MSCSTVVGSQGNLSTEIGCWFIMAVDDIYNKVIPLTALAFRRVDDGQSKMY